MDKVSNSPRMQTGRERQLAGCSGYLVESSEEKQYFREKGAAEGDGVQELCGKCPRLITDNHRLPQLLDDKK